MEGWLAVRVKTGKEFEAFSVLFLTNDPDLELIENVKIPLDKHDNPRIPGFIFIKVRELTKKLEEKILSFPHIAYIVKRKSFEEGRKKGKISFYIPAVISDEDMKELESIISDESAEKIVEKSLFIGTIYTIKDGPLRDFKCILKEILKDEVIVDVLIFKSSVRVKIPIDFL